MPMMTNTQLIWRSQRKHSLLVMLIGWILSKLINQSKRMSLELSIIGMSKVTLLLTNLASWHKLMKFSISTNYNSMKKTKFKEDSLVHPCNLKKSNKHQKLQTNLTKIWKQQKRWKKRKPKQMKQCSKRLVKKGKISGFFRICLTLRSKQKKNKNRKNNNYQQLNCLNIILIKIFYLV